MPDWLHLAGYVLLGIAIIWLLYSGIPDFIYHVLRLRVFAKGYGGERTIALTFDDGPDPVYTPQLLNLLQIYDVKATFFLVGKNVLKHPELVKQLVEKGHEIGIHGFHHKHAWYLTPWQTFREFRLTAQTIQEITGTKPLYFRPPWGMFNLFTRYAGRKTGAEPVLWHVTAYDWRKGKQTHKIIINILRQVTPGSVILLHDSGGAPNAPNNTLHALSEVIPYLKQLEYSFVTISELKQRSSQIREHYHHLKKRWIQPVWNIWEWLFAKLYKVEVIDPLMRLSINRWNHHPVFDEQGTLVAAQGDTVAEMHFQNNFLQSLSSDSVSERMAVKSIRQLRTSLHHVAVTLQYDPRYKQVRAIYGVTLLHRGAAGAGFHVEDIPDTFGKRFLKFFLRWLMMLYHPQGARRLRTHSHLLVPKLVWMSRKELLEQYLQDTHKKKIQNTNAVQTSSFGKAPEFSINSSQSPSC